MPIVFHHSDFIRTFLSSPFIQRKSVPYFFFGSWSMKYTYCSKRPSSLHMIRAEKPSLAENLNVPPLGFVPPQRPGNLPPRLKLKSSANITLYSTVKSSYDFPNIYLHDAPPSLGPHLPLT